ncbi:MAG: DUF6754 domain-containing protein [Leptolinea sp.]
MTSLENLIGLMVVFLTAAFMIVFAMQDRKHNLAFRCIPALEKLDRAVGIAVEDGRRLHISFGWGEFLGFHAASILTNTAALEEISKRSMGSDRTPATTSGNGTSTLLAVDVLQSAQRYGFVNERMDARRGRLAGVTAMSYAAGVLPALHSEHTSTIVFGGALGAELRLILDAAEDEQIQVLAASDSLTGQAVAFSSPVEILIGEEIFALPAYLHAGSMYSASLLAEDSLRWLLIAVILLGAALRSIGLQIL